MPCNSCRSINTRTFGGEIGMHVPGLKGLDRPFVWVFPKIEACLECGFGSFQIPESQLRVLGQAIPVETVEKIAKEFPETNSARNENENTEVRDGVTSGPERWHEVAQKVQHEQDPARMIALVQKLIAAFDEEQLRTGLPPTRNIRNQSDSSET